jgi:hypothetical protein
MSPRCHQLQEDLAKPFHGHFPARTLLADRVILAEYAAEVAVGKKNRSRTPLAGNAGLFPKVQGCPGNFHVFACLAETHFPGEPVCFTISGTQPASGEQGLKHPNSLPNYTEN